MQQNTQAEILHFLKSATTHDAAAPVRIIETHISVVVLQGERAWKLKRAAKLPYADFSTPALRLAACQREVELNQRTAPSIYIGARRITRQDNGELEFDGPGELVDAVVEMHRFDDDTLFSKLAANGRLNRPLLTALARDIAAFHEKAEVRPGEGAANIAAILALNEQSTQMEQALGQEPVKKLRLALRTALERHSRRLDERALAGKIRLCHGDLHLRNLCLVEGRPTLFDCIEFNEALATIDVLYDLAFLLMDLWHTGLPAEANWVMNRYLDESGDIGGLPLLPFFMALRASIRAQVLATQATMPGEPQRDALTAQAQAYLTLALTLLRPGRAQLLAIGGLSGSGKSTLAAAVAHEIHPAPGARIWASDRIRKQQAGVPAETRLPPESYTLESSQQVYNALYAYTRQTLEDGYSVIADAVFSRPAERQAIEQCAAQTGVDFQGIWLETDPATLIARVQARQNDPSDATADVVQAQLQRGIGPLTWAAIPAGDAAGLHSLAGLKDVLQPPPPSWADAPAGWNWLAQDEDGRWFWYAVQPQLGMAGGIWRSPRRAQQFAAQGRPNPLWYESCRQRPA